MQVRLLALLLFAACAHAAVVEGVILDDESGNPLARTQVTLTPLPGTEVQETTVRTGARGAFVILSVRPGWYVLRATRRGYAPGEDGASKPGRPGHAFEVADDRSGDFHEIRMAHLAAITGTVFDENGIGIPNWQVHLYTTNKPMRHVAQTKTDDRGDFRLGELNTGNYVVRSGPGPLEDKTTVLPTYAQAAVELKNALPSHVLVGETAKNVAVRPVKGKLLTVSGTLQAPAFPGRATLTLITDTGRRNVASGAGNVPFTASNIPPGPIEMVVSGSDSVGSVCGSFIELTIDTDQFNKSYPCSFIGTGGIEISGGRKVPIIVRRVDLDGESNIHALERDEQLIPGHWEVTVPRGDYYVQSVRCYFQPCPQAGDWYMFESGSSRRVTIQLSTNYATISGIVKLNDNPVLGAPVFVSNIDTGQSWVVRADPQGHYSAIGLGPGSYSVVSSFNIDDIENLAGKPVTVRVYSPGQTVTQDLELFRP
ncbi:MAG TPA: carboxypeptidase-like regulatory domain-containing protein [Bryobacteraceae bacterium]|nr:carboxypeptidase-like regulatory domain-containing protein [Bryobacteraceae bacterium]